MCGKCWMHTDLIIDPVAYEMHNLINGGALKQLKKWDGVSICLSVHEFVCNQRTCVLKLFMSFIK